MNRVSIPVRDKGVFSSPKSRPSVRLTLPPIQWVPVFFCRGKEAGAWSLPLISIYADVKYVWSCNVRTPTPYPVPFTVCTLRLDFKEPTNDLWEFKRRTVSPAVQSKWGENFHYRTDGLWISYFVLWWTTGFTSSPPSNSTHSEQTRYRTWFIAEFCRPLVTAVCSCAGFIAGFDGAGCVLRTWEGFTAVSLGKWFLTFRKNLSPSSSEAHVQWTLEGEDDTFLRIVGNSLPKDAASRLRRLGTLVEAF
jgi:hypothetical protein